MKNSADRFLVFRLADGEFAMPLLEVIEVISVPPVTPLPNSDAEFLGLCDLRGRIIPLIDLRAKLGAQIRATGPEAGVVVFEIGGNAVGVLVDSIERVAAVPADQISAPPDLGSLTTRAREHVRGVFKHGAKLVVLLALEGIVKHGRERAAHAQAIAGGATASGLDPASAVAA